MRSNEGGSTSSSAYANVLDVDRANPTDLARGRSILKAVIPARSRHMS
jgi:hypothetical protein